MTLWMTLRIGRQDWDYAGDNRTHTSRPPLPCTAGRPEPRLLSTSSVHEITVLTCHDAAVPRIHRAYYDYESYLYRDPRHK
jgi:hypothetical protein